MKLLGAMKLENTASDYHCSELNLTCNEIVQCGPRASIGYMRNIRRTG